MIHLKKWTITKCNRLRKQNGGHGRLRDYLFSHCLFLNLICGVSILLIIPFFILQNAYPALIGGSGLWDFLIGKPWAPLADPPQFGIFHAWTATFFITGLALFFAVPVGFGIGIFIAEVAPDWVIGVIQPSLELLAGIPSVVYGFFGYITICRWFENIFSMVTGESILAAGLILAVMILPYIASTATEALQAVHPILREAGLSLGVTRWNMMRRLLFPKAAPGLFAAVALGLARALGETFAVMILARNSKAVPLSLLDRGQPLTALIATELGEAGVNSAKYHSLFAAGLVLIVVVLAVNCLIWRLKRKLVQHETE